MEAAPTRRTGRLALAAVAALVVLAPLGAGCTDGSDDGPEPSPSPSARESGPPASSPPPSPSGPPRSPFTGEESQNREGVLAVKFDNAPVARPPVGLQDAALVYVEKVEGGLSRLLAVYDTAPEGVIGPVRSARESDLELLRQFGKPAFAYSGIRSALKDDVRRAPVYDVSPEEAGGAYRRNSGRPLPHNLFADPGDLLKGAPEASKPRDIGFRFDDDAPGGGERRERQTVRYPAASFAFEWSGEAGKWEVSMDGRAARTSSGERLAAPTVVVQYVDMPPSKYRDVTGAATPYIETVGEGRATVLRDGRAYATEWKRPAAEDGTVFTRPDGSRMPFDRGQVWIVYAQR